MPQSKEAKREATRERVKRYRAKKDVTLNYVTPSVVVTPDVTPLPSEWQVVKDFISRESNSKMPNLEKLQRIAGSLGKYADEVWFGELSMGDIGRVIGVQAASFTR